MIEYYKNALNWGRATRMEYWFPFFVSCVISALCLGSVHILTLISVINLVPGFTVLVRRLHDTNRSAWNFLWFLFPTIGWVVLIVYLCEKGNKEENKYGTPRIND